MNRTEINIFIKGAFYFTKTAILPTIVLLFHKLQNIVLGFYVIDQHKAENNCEVEDRLTGISKNVKNQKCGWHLFLAFLSHYFVEPCFGAILAASL